MDKFESEFGTTEQGLLRSQFMFDTYSSKMYLDENNNIVGLESEGIDGGKLNGRKTPFLINNLGVGNIVKYIIEEGKYNSIPELFEEINVAYKNRLLRIIKEDNKINHEQKIAA